MEMNDPDPVETGEWIESIRSVLEREGPARANELLHYLRQELQRAGVPVSTDAGTPYVNTIPASEQDPFPGDVEIERRIRSYIRWNALAMVVHANRQSTELGGHIASFASAATLYGVGYDHFFRAASEDHGGDLVYFQGHSAPGFYARAFLEGSVTEAQ